MQSETCRSRERFTPGVYLTASPDTDDWPIECEIPEDALLYFERNGHVCVRSLLSREYVDDYVPKFLQQVSLPAPISFDRSERSMGFGN